jgi:hypothetical protein
MDKVAQRMACYDYHGNFRGFPGIHLYANDYAWSSVIVHYVSAYLIGIVIYVTECDHV